MRVVGLFLATGLLFAACGDSGADTTSTTTQSSSATEAETGTTVNPPPEESSARGKAAADGDLVSVHYRGTLDDGSEFDSSAGRDPLQFVVGSQQVIKGFDDAVRGMRVGESTTVRIPPEEAYGERDPEAILEFPKDEAPEGLVAGDEVTFSNGGRGTVIEITEDTVTIDANHPLAGQPLTFEIELVAVEPGS